MQALFFKKAIFFAPFAGHADGSVYRGGRRIHQGALLCAFFQEDEIC